MGSGEHRPGNRLLRALDETTYRRVAAKLKAAPLAARQVLHRANEPIQQVYFPDSAVIVLMAVMADGGTIQSAAIGLEGASWVSATVGAVSMPLETVVAVAGDARMLDIADFQRELQESSSFREVLTGYSHALLIHSLRMTGCTGLHSLDQRCARWLLMTLDRVPDHSLAITHEFLAALLGAARPSVSAVIEDFQKRGILKLERGLVVVEDRERLLNVSCDCYGAIRQNYDRLPRQWPDPRPA
jgi:CRP-like cAMP-binding protein